NGYRNACFGHYWQVFHFPRGLKDENFVGLGTEAAISTANVVCNEQIQVLGYQFAMGIRYELIGFRCKPYTYQSFSPLTIVRCLLTLSTCRLIQCLGQFSQNIWIAYQM